METRLLEGLYFMVFRSGTGCYACTDCQKESNHLANGPVDAKCKNKSMQMLEVLMARGKWAWG